ncbi:MAG: thioredoxin family protein, partial [Cytophagales bacterium]|nr:thioredoxin family protein [Cytophagales bacterium]
GLISLSFTIYLIPGLWGAPLKGLSGYLPPLSTQDFNLHLLSSSPQRHENVLCHDSPKHTDLFKYPHNLRGYFDYEEALSCAKDRDKLLFVSFTGHGCVNCREIEARIWSDAGVLQRFREDFILVSLFVDEKTELPLEESYISSYDGKVKRTIGQQNSDFQITHFQNNAQPYYIILDPHTELPVVDPYTYSLDIKDYISFLDSAREIWLSRD